MAKYPKVPKGWYANDVEWYIPKRKKPIAYSTVATSDMIVSRAEDGKTIQEIRDMEILFDEERMVLDEYIKRGYGNQVAKEWFK